MNQAMQLSEQLSKASKSLERCFCGSAVVMGYEPGATFVRCFRESKTVAALPDWQPDELAEVWNNGGIQETA